jgi:hypothetical protein
VLRIGLTLLPLKVCRCPRTDPLEDMSSGDCTIPQRRSSRSQTCTALPESVAEAQRVDTALRRHNLVPYEPPHGIGDHGNCFFHAWFDAWALTRFPPLHQDVSELRKAVKQWLCGNYIYLLNKGTIDSWLQEHPDIATTIVSRPKSATHEAWRVFCNGFALTGFQSQGTYARMGDNLTCIAVANLYQARVCVHIGLDQPLVFMPDTAFFCSIHLVLYCAPQWKHFRSTRPIGSASADPQLAQVNSAGLNGHTAESSANWAGVSELARSGDCFSNGQDPDELLRTIAKALPEMDALQSLPRMVKVTMHAAAAALQMVRL